MNNRTVGDFSSDCLFIAETAKIDDVYCIDIFLCRKLKKYHEKNFFVLFELIYRKLSSNVPKSSGKNYHK